MGFRLKRVKDQVIVITGASSGIGLATARQAAKRGARVALIARNEDELKHQVEQIRQGGAQALAIGADVADAAALDQAAQRVVETFGGFDTWVNNAGVSVYGRTLDVPLSDERRLFDVNYWGVVNGSRAAVRHLRERGGALINMGSITSDRAVPLQAAYSASKHAVKGFTDALRMELEQEGAPISVTLVKPTSIDTPYFEHAANYMDREPAPPPPVYAADEVAHVILRCAEKRVRDVTVGGGGRAITLLASVSPRVSDVYMERFMFEAQKASSREEDRAGGLHRSRSEGAQTGKYPGTVMQRSLYTRAALSDAARALPLLGLGVALGLAARRARHP